ncbi:MAG: LamG-like jellyroll fold domain-containing protein [Bacteroidia bacterium]
MTKRFLLVACIYSTALFAQPQNALDFDGFDDYVETPAASGLLTGNNGFSMSCWVNPINTNPAFPNFDGIIGFRNDLNADFYIIQLSSTQFEARLRNENNQVFTITSPTVQLNTWQHLALVYNGTQLRFYHNGQLNQSISASGSISNSTVAFRIGRISFQIYDFNFNGQIDEVGLWSRALSDTEVNCIYRQKINNPMPGLTHYYSMDQGLAGGINNSITSLTDQAGTLNGWLYGFSLNGTTSNFVTGTAQVTMVSDTICPGEIYSLGGQNFNQAGNYTVLLPATQGCDSTIYLQLAEQIINTSVQQNRDTLVATNLLATAWRWLDCNNNFSPINGANAAEFIAQANGSYAVEITQINCKDTSNCVQVSTVGLSETSGIPELRLYPNPANKWLHLYLSTEISGNIHIHDVQGRLIKRMILLNQVPILDISDLTPGVYILSIEGNNQISQQRFIKR